MTHIPTAEQAVAYVRSIERAWDGFKATEIKGVGVGRGGDTRVIVTNNANWDLWFQPDGTIYGEC